jgi:hypothetical protein
MDKIEQVYCLCKNVNDLDWKKDLESISNINTIQSKLCWISKKFSDFLGKKEFSESCQVYIVWLDVIVYLLKIISNKMVSDKEVLNIVNFKEWIHTFLSIV